MHGRDQVVLVRFHHHTAGAVPVFAFFTVTTNTPETMS
jgi:hypothetical protein